MKNRTKTLLTIVGLIILTAASVLIVVIMTSTKTTSDYSYISLNETSLNFYDMDDDFYTYQLDGYKTSIGVDLSEHNIDVDFEKLENQGIEYAILRIGWRGYINPTLHIDKKFEEFYRKAKETDIDIGIYFFSQAINEEEAIEEANFVLENIKDLEIDTYIVFDYETIEDRNARTNNLTRHERTNNAIAFLETIKNAGYEPMLYTNYDWIKHHYEISVLSDYPVWYAQYSKKPQYRGKHIIWQYSTNVKLDGVTSDDGVDLNIMIEKEETN